MASRNIKDCTSFMQHIWSVGLEVWKQQYPHLPVPFLTCTHRTNETQGKLYAQGRTASQLKAAGLSEYTPTKGLIVTWAKPGQSKHNKLPSEAFDIAFKNKEGKLDWSTDLFAKFAAIVKPMGGVEWGGDWKKKDSPHFEQKKE